MKTIYFDSEFTDFIDMKPISIGFVSDDGREFYAELVDTYTTEECSPFVHEMVLPLLNGGDHRMTQAQCVARLTDWLESFNEPVELASDAPPFDSSIIEDLFRDGWPSNLSRGMQWVDADDHLYYQEAEKAWDLTPEATRHHALWDARVMRLAHLQSSSLRTDLK